MWEKSPSLFAKQCFHILGKFLSLTTMYCPKLHKLKWLKMDLVLFLHLEY